MNITNSADARNEARRARLRRLARIVCCACICLASSAQGAQKISALILTGQTDPAHDWRTTTPLLRVLLENSGRFQVRVQEDAGGLTASALAGYDVVVLNYNGPRWGETAESAIEGFLRRGKGMIAVHCVSYGPFYGQEMRPKRRMAGEPWAAYAEMMGVSWKLENIGHSQRHVFPVKWLDKDHPVSRGLDATFLADDELYHKMDFKANVHVLASAFSDPGMYGTGKEEPIVWTVPFAQGRVIHITLGHDVAAMSQPGFVQAFVRGSEWASGFPVTVAPRSAPALVKGQRTEAKAPSK